jgi:hypothetical protein
MGLCPVETQVMIRDKEGRGRSYRYTVSEAGILIPTVSLPSQSSKHDSPKLDTIGLRR